MADGDTARKGEASSSSSRGIALPKRTRWAFLAPAVAGFLFVGHAFEDAGLAGAAPYAFVFLVSFASLAYPSVIGWVLLVVPCGAYLVMIVGAPFAAPAPVHFGEWLVFFLIGAIPCGALWWARPRRSRS